MADASSSCRIVRLPTALVDQIAAGEVVERAASVVKELCENSLDAGARRVEVEITAGGRGSIRIVDDGCGMTPEEARLALERHATSKIRSADDLWGVPTFGFRGEALPSIASVSRLSLQTRTADASEGFLLQVEAGREVQARAVGMPQGTQIEVRDLFYNTPARLKFQKTEATETSNVSEAVLRLALANPDVHFRLRTNGRVAMDLPPHRDLAERVRAAIARRGAGLLHEAVGDENGVCVQAFAAGPDCASTTSRNTFTFVGRRFVRDRSLLQALCMGYGEWLEKGRYPLAVLFVDVAGEDVDVNVHPQKLEVRFAQPQPVYAAVRHVLQAALARAPWQPIPERSFSRPFSAAAGSGKGVSLSAKAALPPEPAFDLDRAFRGPSPPVPAGPIAANAWPAHRAREEAPAERQARLASIPVPAGTALSPLRFVGLLARTFILLEDPALGLVMVDGQAAGERVMFERLRKAWQEGKMAPHKLLFPIPIEVEERGMASFAKHAEWLGPLGFDVEAFGAETLLLRAVPEALAKADPKPLLLELLAMLEGGVDEADVSAARIEPVLAAMARHAAVWPADTLDGDAVAKLLAALDEMDWRALPAHGRPLLARLSFSEIQRRFVKP